MPDPPVIIKVKRLRAGARLPERATPGSAGFDVCADLGGDGEALELGTMPVLVPTGIALEIPAGYEVQVRPRSGLSRKGIDVAFGTVDADYRGELLVNMAARAPGAEPPTIHHGDRIAQIVVAPVVVAVLEEVADLSPTRRGDGGFGSTGR